MSFVSSLLQTSSSVSKVYLQVFQASGSDHIHGNINITQDVIDHIAMVVL